MALKSIKKMQLVTEAAVLEVTVVKEGGPLGSRVEVGSTGTDDSTFLDSQLTPGPVAKQLNPAHSYALLWTAAFVRKGAATLTAKITTASGTVQKIKTKKINGVAGDIVSRVVLIP